MSKMHILLAAVLAAAVLVVQSEGTPSTMKTTEEDTAVCLKAFMYKFQTLASMARFETLTDTVCDGLMDYALCVAMRNGRAPNQEDTMLLVNEMKKYVFQLGTDFRGTKFEGCKFDRSKFMQRMTGPPDGSKDKGNGAEKNITVCQEALEAKFVAAVDKKEKMADRVCGWNRDYALCVARITGDTPQDDWTFGKLVEKYVIGREKLFVACGYDKDKVLREAREGGSGSGDKGNNAGSAYNFSGSQGWLSCSLYLIAMVVIWQTMGLFVHL